MAKKTTTDTSPFFDVMLSEAERNSGELNVYVPGEHGSRYWGIPVEPLVFQYLLGGINILPYGHMIELAGPPGTFKSSLALEMVRWTTEPTVNGLGVYIDAESKTGPTLMPSILGVERCRGRNIQYVCNVDTIEKWQHECTWRIESASKHDENSKFPLLLIVDSVSGRLSDEEQGKFMKEGFAPARGFPVAAKTITGFCKGFPPSILRTGAPPRSVVFVGVNHLKIKPDSMYESKVTTGGVGKDFQASLRIWSKMISTRPDFLVDKTVMEYLPARLRDKGVELVGECARYKVGFACQKSSLGLTGRSINVCLYVGFAADGVQYSWFDWDGALADFLSEYTKKGIGKLSIGEAANSYSVVYDDKKVLTKVSAREAGAWVMQNEEAVKDIQQFFHLFQYREHRGNQPYQEIFAS